MMILATFSSCCCYEYEFWLPFPPAAAKAFAAAVAAAGPQIGKRHGSEGRRNPKLHLVLLLLLLLLLLL